MGDDSVDNEGIGMEEGNEIRTSRDEVRWFNLGDTTSTVDKGAKKSGKAVRRSLRSLQERKCEGSEDRSIEGEHLQVRERESEGGRKSRSRADKENSREESLRESDDGKLVSQCREEE